MRAIVGRTFPHGRFETIARAVVERYDAFRLRPVHVPDLRSPCVDIGVPPDVQFIWSSSPDSGWLSSGVRVAASRNEVEFHIAEDARGTSSITVTAPTYCADRPSLETLVARIVRSLTGRESVDCRNEISYVAFADWLHGLDESKEAWRGRLYWRRVMREQALDGSRPEPAAEPAEVHVRTPIPAKFRQLPVERRESLAAVAWLHIARVMTGNRALAIGCWSDGRSDESLRDAVGPFASFIPMALRERPQGTRELMSVATRCLVEGRQWQEFFDWDDVPSEESDLDYFPYCLEYCLRPAPDDVALRLETCEADADRYLVLLRCEERDADLCITVRARDARMTTRDLTGFAERWLGLIERSLDSPDTSFWTFDVLTAQERLGLHSQASDQGARLEPGDVNETVPDMLERACRQCPDRAAIAWHGGALTFSMLHSLANAFAALLPASAGRTIAVHADPSADSIVALVAVLRAGATYVWVSPHQAEAHRRQLLKQAGTTVVLSDRSWPEAEAAGLDVLDIRAACAAIARDARPSWTAACIHHDQPACVSFAGDPTGELLGISVSHRSIVNVWRALVEAIPSLKEPARVGPSQPVFRNGAIDALVHVLSGHTLVLSVAQGPDGLSRWLSEGHVDVADVTTWHLAHALAAKTLQQTARVPGALLVRGGPPPEPLKRYLQAASAHSVYGPSECTGHSLVGRIAATSPAGTLGEPLPRSDCVVTDGRSVPLPAGVTGTLCVSGAGLALGYVGAPARTAERFVPSPFGGGRRVFRTSDLAARNEDNTVQYRGAGSARVRIRGRQVSLRAVQAALEAHPGVAAAIVAPPHARAGSHVAWVVPLNAASDRAPDGVTERELKAFLAARLPESHIPARAVVLERVPIAADGTVDQLALRATLAEHRAGDRPPASRTALEEQLLREWQQILDGRDVDVDANFLEAGGDSFSIAQLNLRLRRMLRLEVPLVDMFKYSSIRSLAEHVATLNQHPQ